MNKCSYINMSLNKEDIKWEKKKRHTPIIMSMKKVAAVGMSITTKNTSIMPIITNMEKAAAADTSITTKNTSIMRTTMNMEKAAAADMSIIMKNRNIIIVMSQTIYREKFIL